WRVLRWLLRDDAPLLFRPRLDAQQWRWGLDFLRECLPGRSARNMRQMVALGLHSRDTLRMLRRELGIDYQQLQQGILTLLFSEAELIQARAGCAQLQKLGVEKSLLTPAQALQREPALARILPQLRGACWSPDDESGNVHLFTVALAQACALRGVEFRFQTRINALE
ncbi:amino acid dehydrogenase, partial [Pseudomonas sp. MWU13-2860]